MERDPGAAAWRQRWRRSGPRNAALLLVALPVILFAIRVLPLPDGETPLAPITVLAALGVIPLALAAWRVAAQLRTRRWPSAECLIEDRGVQVHEPLPGARFASRSYEPFVRFRYHVDGVPYASRRIRLGALYFTSPSDAIARAERYPAGATRTCRYDPRDPSRAVLETGLALAPVVPLLVIAATMLATLAFVAARIA